MADGRRMEVERELVGSGMGDGASPRQAIVKQPRKLPKVDGFASKQIAHSSFFKRSQDRRAEQELKRHAKLRDANLIRMYNLQEGEELSEQDDEALDLDQSERSQRVRSPFRGYEYYEQEFDEPGPPNTRGRTPILRIEPAPPSANANANANANASGPADSDGPAKTQVNAAPQPAAPPDAAAIHAHLRHYYPSKKTKTKAAPQLTKEQWQIIKRYYDHHVFGILRSMSLFVQIGALIVGTIALIASCWVFRTDIGFDSGKSSERNLWQEITLTRKEDINGTSTHTESTEMRKSDLTIIILHSFGVMTALISAILTVRGFCSRKLPRRLYNFHSAAELLFVGSIASGVSMLTCFVSMTMDESAAEGTMHLGYGFVFGLALPILLLIAAFFMVLDDLLQLIMMPKLCLIDCLFCCCTSCLEKRFMKPEA